MKISILGGGGFLGRKIAARLARDGKLGGQPITGADAVRSRGAADAGRRIPDHCAGRRPRGPAARGDPAWHRRRVPPRRGGLRPGRGRLRAGPPGQPARHRRRGRCLPPPGRRRGQAAARGVHLFGRQLLRRAGRAARRRRAAGAGEQLWRAEGGRRTDPGGRVAPRLPRCGVDPPARRSSCAPAGPTAPPARSSRRSSASRCSGCQRNCRCPTPSPPGCAARAARSTGCCTRRRWTPRRWASTAASIRPASAPRSRICCRRWTRCSPARRRWCARVEDKEIAAIVGLWPPAFEAMHAPHTGLRRARTDRRGGARLRRRRSRGNPRGARNRPLSTNQVCCPA